MYSFCKGDPSQSQHIPVMSLAQAQGCNSANCYVNKQQFNLALHQRTHYITSTTHSDFLITLFVVSSLIEELCKVLSEILVLSGVRCMHLYLKVVQQKRDKT